MVLLIEGRTHHFRHLNSFLTSFEPVRQLPLGHPRDPLPQDRGNAALKGVVPQLDLAPEPSGTGVDGDAAD